MKKTLLLMIFASLLISMVSCEKELMDYQGENSIYFDVRRGKDFRDSSFWARQYYTHVNFIEIVGDTFTLDLRVAISGPVTNYPRTFIVDVVEDSTTAVEGVNYDFQREWVVPAGSHEARIKVNLYKQEDLEENPRTIMFRVQENENFTTNLNFDKELPGRDNLLEDEKKYNSDPRFHTVELAFSIKKPEDWWGYDYPDSKIEMDVFGAFTAKKYLLMLDVMGYTESMFCEIIKSKDNAEVIGEIFARYLVQQFQKGEPVLEKDGRLMWVQALQVVYKNPWTYYQYEW